MDRPVINHIAWIGQDGEWHHRDFLPMYSHLLKWAQDMKCPETCELQYHCHPMVLDQHNVGHKLCTLTVIKAGLVKAKEILSFDSRPGKEEACGGK